MPSARLFPAREPAGSSHTRRSAPILLGTLAAFLLPAAAQDSPSPTPPALPAPVSGSLAISGIYPHLAHTNGEGEVGIGAVVEWAGHLWTNTYGPHLPHGSTDKLRQIDLDGENWTVVERPESVGGTPANRFIHPETNQLVIGHHVIAADGAVRTIDPALTMPGRITGNARHLTDPAHRVYYQTMEDGLYDVDLATLEVTPIIPDPIDISQAHLPGYHSKGAATSNGRLVVSNNGSQTQQIPSGCLASWDGTGWTIVARNQFVEVATPGGLTGIADADGGPDRLWATGWDQQSVRLFLLQDGQWQRFRLPKGSYTHDAAHGWNTEWPRIRSLRDDLFLGHMHGLFFEFPRSFASGRTNGIRILGSYAKMPVDYTLFHDRLVIGKDDASKFDNEFVAQAQSNLWIGDYAELSRWGPRSGFGGVWLDQNLEIDSPSEPFLVGGFDRATLHLRHADRYPVRVGIQVDPTGSGDWQDWQTVLVPREGYLAQSLAGLPETEWVRLVARDAAHGLTAYFQLSSPHPNQTRDAARFAGLTPITEAAPAGATLRLPRGLDLQLQAFAGDRQFRVDGRLQARPVQTGADDARIATSVAIEADSRLGVDAASAFVETKDAQGREVRLRLPKGDPAFDATLASERHIREIVTERTHLNLHGTWYELPRPRAGAFLDFRHMKPIASHSFHIADFCSWRGMLVFSGANPAHTAPNQVRLDDTHALWLGEVDDLWKLGKPVGTGGPWLDTPVRAGQASDPYLMLGYEQKTIRITHDGSAPIRFGLDIDFLGTGEFSRWQTPVVGPGETFELTFPEDFAAHWIRAVAGARCTATVQLEYR